MGQNPLILRLRRYSDPARGQTDGRYFLAGRRQMALLEALFPIVVAGRALMIDVTYLKVHHINKGGPQSLGEINLQGWCAFRYQAAGPGSDHPLKD